jgi:aminopeptidase N
VTAATADGKALKVESTGRTGAVRGWRVHLPAGTARLRLEYSGTLPTLDRSRDHRGVLLGMPPMTSPQGSFLPAGSAWYPRPAQLFSYRLSLSVPADQRALVPGRLISEDLPLHGAGRYRARFEFAQPGYGIDLMAGPWVIREKMMPRPGGEPVRLRTYFMQDLDAMPGLADGYLEDTRGYLERYSREIGSYPFDGFSIVAGPLPTGFGMPTLTYLGEQVIKLPFIRATSLGHEVLHNWWGNGVYVDYASGNWSEGLTTFMADYAYKEQESAEAAREMRLGWLRDFSAIAPDRHTALRDFRSRTHGAAAAVGYGKAAMLFVMLRDTIGEQAFSSGIRSFWENHRFQRASWSELQVAFEKASGKPLNTFFHQWLDRPGGPSLTVSAAGMESEGNKPQVLVTLEQTAPAYALHVPIELVFGDHSETRWIDITRLREQVRLDVPAAPQGIRVDPDLRVWRVLDPGQLPPILRQWFISRTPRLVLASESDEVRAAAVSLAQRLFEVAPRVAAPQDIGSDGGPVLLVGLHEEIDAMLERAGLAPRPKELSGQGSAQVWTVQGDRGAPLAVVSGESAEALKALQRPLPHYGSQSWLVFDGSRALARGTWPAPGRLIPIEGRR